MGIPDTGFIEAGSEIARERAAEIEAIFTKHCSTGGLSGEWRAMESFSGDSALSGLESARCADLVIAQQRDPDSDSIVADLEALLFHSGRPALFIPYAIKAEPPFRRITLAWNGSAESARAAFDALDDAALPALRASGALALAHAHFVALRQVAWLRRAEEARALDAASRDGIASSGARNAPSGPDVTDFLAAMGLAPDDDDQSSGTGHKDPAQRDKA